MNTKRLQAISGLYFGAFMVLHLVNHCVLLVGESASRTRRHREVAMALRVVYQHPVAEALLALSLAIHIVLGVMDYWNRNASPETKDSARWTWSQFLSSRKMLSPQNMHRLSGWILLAEVPIHVFGARVKKYFQNDTDPNVDEMLAKLRTTPLVGTVYLSLLTVMGAYHLVSGTVRALNTVSGRLLIKQQSTNYTLLTGAAMVLAGLITAAAAGATGSLGIISLYVPVHKKGGH